MKKHNTEANTMFKEELDIDVTPLEITKIFITDYYKWNEYAYLQSETEKEEKDWNIGKSYDNLILKYCGADKKYQGLAYGNDGERVEDFTFLEETISDDSAIVKVKYQDPEMGFRYSTYEYHFEKIECKWILIEKYWIDEDTLKKNKYL